jgi:hypothetical protein
MKEFKYLVIDHMGRPRKDEQGNELYITASNKYAARKLLNALTGKGGEWYGKFSAYHSVLVRQYYRGYRING